MTETKDGDEAGLEVGTGMKRREMNIQMIRLQKARMAGVDDTKTDTGGIEIMMMRIEGAESIVAVDEEGLIHALVLALMTDRE